MKKTTQLGVLIFASALLAAAFFMAPSAANAEEGGTVPTEETAESDNQDSGTAVKACNGDKSGAFLGINPWYYYLDGTPSADGEECNIKISNLNDIWLIVLAVLQALLRVAAYIGVGVIIFAGFMYMTSSGSPERTKQALGTIRLAAIGLVISIASTLIVGFIAGRF